MGKTVRDSVWEWVLLKCLLNGEDVTAPNIAEETRASERTARDVLGVMVEDRWLERRRRPDGGVKYRAGPRLSKLSP